jgi:stalled ribosome alternative rescue factor ArfA
VKERIFSKGIEREKKGKLAAADQQKDTIHSPFVSTHSKAFRVILSQINL